MNGLDVETLVGLVVAAAKVDTTSPDPTNLRNGWRTDLLLTQCVDKFVVIDRNQPATYAEIGRQVLEQVRGLPEMEALARLAIFRGERLLPLNPEREQELKRMARELQEVISALPEGARRTRCQSLLNYHGGVFANAYGDFELASELQARSAEDAEQLGDVVGCAIARFMAQLYALKHAMVKGSATPESFFPVEDEFQALERALKGSSLEVLWAQGNGPVHMIEACVWLNQTSHPQWDRWQATASEAAPKLGETHVAGLECLKALDLSAKGSPEADEALKKVAADSGVEPEAKVTVLLALVRRALETGDRQEAEELISRMPWQGAQHIVALAHRALVS